MNYWNFLDSNNKFGPKKKWKGLHLLERIKWARWRWFNLWQMGLLRYLCTLLHVHKTEFFSFQWCLLLAKMNTDELTSGWASKRWLEGLLYERLRSWRQFWRFRFSFKKQAKAPHQPLIPILGIRFCSFFVFISIQNGRLVKYNFMDDCKYRLQNTRQVGKTVSSRNVMFIRRNIEMSGRTTTRYAECQFQIWFCYATTCPNHCSIHSFSSGRDEWTWMRIYFDISRILRLFSSSVLASNIWKVLAFR